MTPPESLFHLAIHKDSELYRALKRQWDHRNKNSPYAFADPESGKKSTHRNRFTKGLCKRSGVKPFGFKAQ